MTDPATTASSAPTIRPRFWSSVAKSLHWVWSAAAREFLISLVAQVVGALALGLVLLCGRNLARALTIDPVAETVYDVLPSVVCLGGALFVSGLSRVVQQEARFVVGELLVHQVEGQIIAVASSVDYERFEEQEFNDLRDRATGEGAIHAQQLVFDLFSVLTSVITSLSLMVVLAVTVPSILPLLLLVAVPFLLAGRASARLAFRTAYDLTADDRLRWSLFWTLVGKTQAKEVRIFELRHPLRDRWSVLFEERARRIRRIASRRTLFNGLASAASSMLVAGLLVVIVVSALNGEVLVADAAVAVVALQQIAGRLRSTSSASGSLHESALFLADFEHFSAQAVPLPDRAESVPLPSFDTLSVSGLSFVYPGTQRPVLHDVDIEVGRGEIVALVGASGSGKTTLAHLIAGLYRPTTGTITWDGVDISSIPRENYWRSLAVVHQDFVQYELTARENIGISEHRRMDDLSSIVDAARRASIDETIQQLPRGYETMLSRTYEGGADLSGGEWQRLAVARAFFRKAPLVILDEPAAALDALAERTLYEQLVELCVGRSALLISHRFSTVRMATRIYVLQAGRIVEAGSHDELMELDGHYAGMFRVQAAGYSDGSWVDRGPNT